MTVIANPRPLPRAAIEPATTIDAEINDLAQYIPLRDAAASLRSGRNSKSKRVHVATLYRWTDRGCRGVRLKYVQIGTTRATTRAWLDDFFAALAGAVAPAASPIRAAVAHHRAAQIEDARAEAVKYGINPK